MRCRARLVAVAGTIALFPHLAAAQCLTQVDDLATALNMSTELPEPADLAATPGEDAVSDLAESGGVIAPPPVGDDMPVLEPAAGTDGDMATAPPMDAQPPAGTDSPLDEAAARTQVEALLTAARQAAEAGEEDGCLDRLQEATALAAAHGLPTPE